MSDIAQLKRSINLPLLTFYGLGSIVGAGIYVLVGKVAGSAGYGTAWAFLVAAIIAGFTAFTYGELSSRYPKSAGEALYIQKAFGQRWLSSVTGWSLVAVGVVSSATIINGFVGYLEVFIQLPAWLVILSLTLGLGLVAAWGIKESAWFAAIITVIELGGLVFVVVIATTTIEQWPDKLPTLIPEMSGFYIEGVLLGAFLAFYAFIGYEDMVNVAEEVKQPQTTMPKAIIIALIVSALLYITVALVAVLAVPPEILQHSNAPLASIVERHSNSAVTAISLISLIAVINGALIQTIMASRVLYGMGNLSLAPHFFSRIHPKTQTPLLATTYVVVAILLLALWFPLITLATMTSYITLSIFAAMHAALWWLKHRKITVAGAVSYPQWLPMVGFFLCISLIIFQTIAG